MGKETTIGLSRKTKKLLNKEKNDGDNYEDTIKNLLALKQCPECGEKTLKIWDTYMFEPLYFDLKCPNCDYKNTHWKLPFEVVEK